jgi:hypothetical protein
MQHDDGPLGRVGRPDPSRPAEERLAAALEALSARDGLLAERSRRLAALEAVADRLTAVNARLDGLTDELAALRLARRAELAERDARITTLEAALGEAPGRVASRERGPDDLHEAGITTFRQIALLSAEQERRVGDLLGVFRGRVGRDRWRQQAAELARPQLVVAS